MHLGKQRLAIEAISRKIRGLVHCRFSVLADHFGTALRTRQANPAGQRGSKGTQFVHTGKHSVKWAQKLHSLNSCSRVASRERYFLVPSAQALESQAS